MTPSRFYDFSAKALTAITEGHPFVLQVWKPVGETSFDVIRLIKSSLRHQVARDNPSLISALKNVKVGHFGTLDPFACGLMLVAFNKALRLADYVHELCPKTYVALGRFCHFTDSGDNSGTPCEMTFSGEHSVFSVTQASQSFLGEYWQKPSRFSASKYQGKCLYEWSRAGIEVPIEAKKRTIYSLEVETEDEHFVCFRSTVSSGTFIRVLMEDLCLLARKPGHLHGLIRESIGTITINSFDNDLCATKEVTREQLFPDLPVIVVSEDVARAWRFGQSVTSPVKNLSSSLAPYCWANFATEWWLVPVKEQLLQKPLLTLQNF